MSNRFQPLARMLLMCNFQEQDAPIVTPMCVKVRDLLHLGVYEHGFCFVGIKD